MSYKVVIPTAGIGSRLFSLTKNLNKSLVSLNNKPIICHIIEKFPKDCKFIIPIGHKGKLVKDFLKITYPKFYFKFVKIKNYSGKNSGLGLSLLKAKKYLQEPFIFIPCDTLVKQKINPPVNNWVGYANKTSQDESFRRCVVNKGYLNMLVEKNFKKTKNQFPYTGLCGIKDYKEFWKSFNDLNNSNFLKGESFAIQKMLLKLKFKAKKYEWFDVGNLKSYENTKSIFEKKKIYNILEKENEAIWFVNNKVIKYSIDKDFIKKRYLRTKYLNNYVPKIVDIKDNFYTYNLQKGKIFSSNPTQKNLKKLLDHSASFWNLKKINNANKEQKLKSKKFYKEKTLKRIKLFYKLKKSNDNINKISIINDTPIKPLKYLLNKINWEDLCSGLFGRYHGDYHFENILITKKKNFLFLDWRQDFEGDISKGDIYYDLAKLMHGMIVSHPQVNLNKFKFIKKGNNIKIDIFIPDNIKKCRIFFYKWLEKNNLKKKRVDLLTSLIFLNIAPLHHYPYNMFLFNLGKIMLQKTLNDEEFNF